MPFYELMTITSLSASHANLISLFNKIHRLIELNGGVFRSIDHLGLRPLASRMRRHNRIHVMGRYIRLSIQCSPASINDIEERLRIDESIIRYMTIKHQQIVPQIHPKTPVYLTKGLRATQSHALSSNASIEAIRHTTPLDYYVAQTLLNRGIIQKLDIAELPRYIEDKQWQHISSRMIKKVYQELQLQEKQTAQQEEEEEESSTENEGEIRIESNDTPERAPTSAATTPTDQKKI